MQERALHTADSGLLALMTKRCGVALRGQRNKGVVASTGGPGQVLAWQIAC